MTSEAPTVITNGSLAGAYETSVVVANLGALWVEAERLVGAPLDPLDPGLVHALG